MDCVALRRNTLPTGKGIGMALEVPLDVHVAAAACQGYYGTDSKAKKWRSSRQLGGAVPDLSCEHLSRNGFKYGTIQYVQHTDRREKEYATYCSNVGSGGRIGWVWGDGTMEGDRKRRTPGK